MKGSFKSITEDVSKTLREDQYPGVMLYGPKSRGAGQRMKHHLSGDFRFVEVRTGEVPELPDSEKQTVLFVDMKHFKQGMPESFKGRKALVVDESATREDASSPDPFNNYCGIEVDYFIDHSAHDIDPGLSRLVSELYLNTFDAFVDYEDITLPNGETTSFYFKTSELIAYNRSRIALEGAIASAILKFNPQVIASRETVGIPPEDHVRMYELAQTVVERLRPELPNVRAVKISDINEGDEDWEKRSLRYVVRGDVKGKNVLLLEDVLCDGSHKEEIMKAIHYAHGKPQECVVLMDRAATESGIRRKLNIYALTDLKTFANIGMETGKLGVETYLAMQREMDPATKVVPK